MVARLLSWMVSSLIHWLGLFTILSLTLLLIALCSVAWALAEVIQGPGLSLLLSVAVEGLLLGWILAAARPVPGWLAILVLFGLGVELILLRVGHLGSTVISIGYGLANLAGQLWRWPLDGTPTAHPLIVPVTELWLGLITLLSRLYGWSLALGTGDPFFDPIAITLVWCLALGSVAAWAGWGVRRLEHPLLAVAPAGALLATTLAYALRQMNALLPVVGVTLLLMGLVGHYTRERRWQASGIDFSTDIRSELGMAVAAISFCLVIIASAAPSIAINAIVRPVQAYFRAETINESLGLRRNPAPNNLPNAIRAPGLPRQHLLGSGPELSEQVALVIKANDIPTDNSEDHSFPRYYWRSLTYDTYTGRGWITSKTKAQAYGAGEAAIDIDVPGHYVLSQEVQVMTSQNDLIYAAGELISIDHDYTINWRGSADAFAALTNATSYQANSLVPAISEVDLRSVGTNYPDWVQHRYLSLSPQIPDRVRSLARDLTATAPTPYDRAKAIEHYLRDFPYSLDLPEPPLQRDVVDFFLFDLQQGYCDYYATSMVVLARAAGLPARLAVGYLGGRYDAASGQYEITEAEAHSWAEIYFPDYGWINFEPTGGRPALERPTETGISPPPAPASAPGETAKTESFLWWQGLSGGLALLLLVALGWWLIDGWRLKQAAPTVAVTMLYRRLYRNGQRLASPTEIGNTPYEFAAALTERLTSLSPHRRLSTVLRPASQEIHRLTELYVQTCYSPHPPNTTTRTDAIQTWRRLRPRLWLARLYYASKRVQPKPKVTSVEKSCRDTIPPQPL